MLAEYAKMLCVFGKSFVCGTQSLLIIFLLWECFSKFNPQISCNEVSKFFKNVFISKDDVRKTIFSSFFHNGENYDSFSLSPSWCEFKLLLHVYHLHNA